MTNSTALSAQPIDELLTEASLQYIPKDYIAGNILTPRTSDNTSGKFAVYSIEAARCSEDLLVGGKTKYPSTPTVQRSTGNYDIKKYGLSDMVTEEDFRNVNEPFDAQLDVTVSLQSKMRLQREKDLAAVMGDVNNYNSGVNSLDFSAAPTSQWNDYVDSTPSINVRDASTAMYLTSGFLPNTAIVSTRTFKIMTQHPEIVNRSVNVKDMVGGSDFEQVRAFLGVERLLIGGALFDDSGEPEARSSTFTQIWGNDLIFIYAPTTPGIRQSTFGYSFRHPDNAVTNGMDGVRVFTEDVTNPPRAIEILTDLSYDDVVVDEGRAGYIIKDVVA